MRRDRLEEFAVKATAVFDRLRREEITPEDVGAARGGVVLCDLLLADVRTIRDQRELDQTAYKKVGKINSLLESFEESRIHLG